MTERVLTPPIDPITAPVRSNAVDIVKGLAILLVTYEHTGQGMAARGWWTGPSRDFSYHYVYSFHMPAFFFVAGLFVAGSIRRRGPKGFVLEKMKTLLYLYVGWAILLTAIEPLIRRFKQSPTPVHWANFPISLRWRRRRVLPGPLALSPPRFVHHQDSGVAAGCARGDRRGADAGLWLRGVL